ncbi:MAG TPA: NAD(P)/FAD-dependent oxidoreductase [Porticoccus sp.]|nr:NAD(P)/FAD-dependent oxidoreductase [Porticoccus sp.]
MITEHLDVLIVGGGPAGSTAAALLVEAGLKVCIVEKEPFPRFKIGESLLPGGNDILKRLGIWEKMDDAGFIRKYGAEFVSSDGSSRVHNIFSEGLVKGLDYTYQVERSKFDLLLLNNAIKKGASLLQPAKVISTELKEGQWQVAVEAENQTTQYQATWLLDASGRDAFFGKKQKLAQDTIPYPKRFAVYSHFKGVKRNSGKEAGNIIITRLRDGWFWSIPLDDDKTSVGVVSVRKRDEWKDPNFTAETFFNNEIKRSTYLSGLLENAQALDDFRITADYTYSFSDYAGPQHMLLGDAAGFIDPIFSSGVYLAMRSATMAVDAILPAHREKRTLTTRDCNTYTKKLKSNVRVMRNLIEVYYDPKGFTIFMSPSEKFKLFQSVNSIVAGNSNPGFSLRWRFRLFLLLCKINKRFKLAPDQELA